MTGLGIILLSYFMYIQMKAITEMDEKGGGIFVKEDSKPEPAPEPVAEEIAEPTPEPEEESLLVEEHL